jgi:flagellar biosynthetic protein FlhB
MAESPTTSSRNQPPTARRLRRARDDGELPPSSALNGAAALIGAALVVDLGAGPAWRELAAFTGDVLSAPGVGGGARVLDVEGLATWGRQAAWLALRFVGVPMVVVWAAAVGAGLLQTRGLVRWEAAAPDARRIFGSRGAAGSALVGPFASLVPALGAIAVAAVCLLPWSQELSRMGALAPRSLLVVLALGARSLGGALLAAVVTSAIGQTLWTRARQRRRLMMSPGEVRRELRELEGEPSLRRERRRRMSAPAVSDATPFISGEVDCVVVGEGGPHDGGEDATAAVGAGAGASRWGPWAVALRYRPPGDDAPVVADRAEGPAAVIMGERALARGVPCREDVALARALVRLARGAPVPASLFEAVARHFANLDAGPGRGGGGARNAR